MRTRTKSIVLVGASLGLVGAVTFLAQSFWRESGLRALQALNKPRIELVANAMRAEISRQDHLPFVLSVDPDVLRALAESSDVTLRDRLNGKLKRVSREADTRALYVIAPSGKVFATDDAGAPGSLLGRDLSDRPYFRSAMASGRSAFLGVEPGSDRARYYVANAIGESPILGIAVVRIEFDQIEADWERAGERVLVTDAQGKVFLSSDPSLRNRILGIAPDTARRNGSAVESGVDTAQAIDFKVLEEHQGSQIVRIQTPDDTNTYLYQPMRVPEYGWTVHRLSDLTTVATDQRDGGIIGAAISILAVSGLFYLRQRQQALVAAQKAGAKLSTEVANRTQELRAANAALHSEVDERKRTETRLRNTQNSLVQAGKLAALGQMSAAIAHEINQPLAAIRTFVASTKVFSERSDSAKVGANLDLISGLAERMANITSHLKTFARKSEPGKPEIVDVDRAIHGSMLLMESQLRLAGVTVEIDVPRNVFVKGYAVQLEQVIVNLLQNALQAVAEADNPAVRLEVAVAGTMVKISVSDNGAGIAQEHIDQIFDPFFTTKAIGKGLGLGLSISYGIVRDFGGEIRAINRIGGGAEMIIELPRYHPESAMLHV